MTWLQPVPNDGELCSCGLNSYSCSVTFTRMFYFGGSQVLPQRGPSSARPTSATEDTCPGRRTWSRWTSSSTARGCTRRPTDTHLPSDLSSSPPPGRSLRPASLQKTGHVSSLTASDDSLGTRTFHALPAEVSSCTCMFIHL